MRRLSVMLGFVVALSALRAEVVWNTVGTSYSVSAVVGFKDSKNSEWAVPFMPAADYALTSIALPLSLTGSPGLVTVALAADEDGHPGEPIETLPFTPTGATKPTLHTIDSVRHPKLRANTQYWIMVSATNPTQVGWLNGSDRFSSIGRNSSSIARLQAFRLNGGTWSLIWAPEIPGVVILGGPASRPGVAKGVSKAGRDSDF